MICQSIRALQLSRMGIFKGYRRPNRPNLCCSLSSSNNLRTNAECTLSSVVYDKIIANQSNKYFDKSIEKDMYQWWEQAGYFKPAEDSITITSSRDFANRPTFVIPMPPPNVTGSLHMGHALFVTLQDILVRYRRMSGYNTLWLPGTDHAGIATQMVVEKELASMGELRRNMTRETFVERVWEWKRKTGGYITQQLRLLGASADWSREKFTLDEDICDAVVESFSKLHDKGLVYRSDNYMVHWSPVLQTALSDLEVEYSEEEGWMYTFKYPLAATSNAAANNNDQNNDLKFIPISTTRPETLLGDTAICVSPKDPRYAHLIGRSCVVPFCNREIPILADNSVDPEFGTGALKVTPAHDPVDYNIGLRHNLPRINIMNKDGTINEVGDVSRCRTGESTSSSPPSPSSYQGLDRFVAREQMWRDLETAGMAISKEKHMQRVPRSQRSGEIIESMISPQWFVRACGMAAKASHCVKSKQLTILPERYEKTWYNWLAPDKIKDWCISRQLWWGHRIPVYYVVGSQKSQYVVARSAKEAVGALCEKYSLNAGDIEVEQEVDVLDTWFSSGLWPFATVGWPHEINDTGKVGGSGSLQKYFPATLLETGHDILFFWVARMVMMSIELTGQVPFSTVYLHGLVTDSKGQKMSKTKGNVIDPVEVISEYGTDVLRFSLITASSTTHDIALSPKHFDITKTFVTKVWNMGKFMEHMLMSAPVVATANSASEEGSESESVKPPLGSLSLREQGLLVEQAHRYLSALSPGLSDTDSVDSIAALSEHMSLTDRVMLLKVHSLVRLVTQALLDTPPGSKAGAYRSPEDMASDLISARHDGVDNRSSGSDSAYYSPQVSEAARAVYDFMWGEYAAWYIETNKLQLSEAARVGDVQRRNTAIVVNSYIWQLCLQMLHPFAPFITESLWISLLRKRTAQSELDDTTSSAFGSIMLSQWPGVKLDSSYTPRSDVCNRIVPLLPCEYPSVCAGPATNEAESQLLDDYSVFQSVVRAVRNIKAEHKVDPNRRVPGVLVYFPPENQQGDMHSAVVDTADDISNRLFGVLLREKQMIGGLVKSDSLQFTLQKVPDLKQVDYTQAIAERGVIVYVPLESLKQSVQKSGTGNTSVAAALSEKESLRLEKQKQKLMTQIAQLEERLSPTHPYFLKAKPSNIEQTRAQLAKAQAELDSFR